MIMSRPKNKKEQFWPNFRRYFREYSEVTGIHGLRYIAEKRSLAEKIFWLIVLVFSLICCVYMISEIWIKYKHSPIVLSFENVDTAIYEIPFPAVTICPESKCSKKKFNFTEVYWKINGSKTVTDEELTNFEYMRYLCNMLPSETSPGQLTMDDDFHSVIRQLQPDYETLYSCQFLGLEMPCNKLFTPVVTDQGLCYTFNNIDYGELLNPDIIIDPFYNNSTTPTSNFNLEIGYPRNSMTKVYPFRALLSGFENSLTIKLIQDQSNIDYLCKESSQGFRVLVHNPFTLPRLETQYFSVSDDTQVIAAVKPNLVITSKAVKRFTQAKRQCFLPDERKLEYFRIYTQENCYLDCLTRFTLKICGCVEFYMPRRNTTAICGHGNRRCITKAELGFKILDIDTKLADEIALTYCNCQPLCSDLRYDTETSQNYYNMRRILQAKQNIKVLKQLGQKVLVSKLSVYFKDEQFRALERRELYGISDLISNFGGLLGLFTGFSILSVVELIYFLSIRIFCNRRIHDRWAGPLLPQ